MHTCYIIDDEEHAIETLTGYVNRHPSLHLVGSNINPLKAIEAIKNHPGGVEIVFLDVDMPELSGLEVADMLSPHSAIIFTTAYPNYAVQAFEKNVSDFLLKPISFERFSRSVNKVQDLIKSQQPAEAPVDDEHFFINPGTKGKVVQLRYSDIQYIEGLKNYVIIYTADHNKYITYLSIQDVEKAIPQTRFARIHKSFIVNLDQIKFIDSNQVFMTDKQLPVGRLFKDSFFNVVQNRTLKSGRKR